MKCPYCEVEITMSQVDAEDGYCPECGAVITAAAIFDEHEEDDIDEIEELDTIEVFDKIEEIDDLKEDF